MNPNLMNPNLNSAMLAAAELTAAGDLNAATVLIQRALAGDTLAADAATATSGDRTGSGRRASGFPGAAAWKDVIDVEARWKPDGGEHASSPKVAGSSAGAAAPAGEPGSETSSTPAGGAPEAGAAPAGSAASGIAGQPAAARPISGKPDWQAFAAGIAAKAAALRRTGADQPRPDWQAFAANIASTAAAFQQADAGAGHRPDLPQAHAGKGRILTGTFTAPAGSRDYLLYLPIGDAPAAGRPLVVMLHGCTQNPADFAAGTAMNELADQHGFVVLYPGQSKGANQSACWNWFNPRDQRAGGGEPSIIAGMVRDLAPRHGVDPGRIYVAGLSAGGAMAAVLAEAYPELFAAVAVHSGLPPGAAQDLPSALAAMKRGAATAGVPAGAAAAAAAGAAAGSPRHRRAGKAVRTIVFHGRQDKTVHPTNGRQVVDAALSGWPADELVARQEQGRSPGGRSFTRTVHADAAGRPMVEQWEVQGAGHAWFGGSTSGSYTDPKGPDASAAFVAFFLAGQNADASGR